MLREYRVHFQRLYYCSSSSQERERKKHRFYDEMIEFRMLSVVCTVTAPAVHLKCVNRIQFTEYQPVFCSKILFQMSVYDEMILCVKLVPYCIGRTTTREEKKKKNTPNHGIHNQKQ